MLSWPTRELQLLDTQQTDLSTILPTVSTYLLRVWIMNSLRIATFTFVIYDIIMTFDREVYYVWKSRWTFAKSVFLINRYIPPVVLAFQLVRTVVSSPSSRLRPRGHSACTHGHCHHPGHQLRLNDQAFVACFAPPIAIVSSAKLLTHDSDSTRDAELSERVSTYISLVSGVDPALVPWQLERCFVRSLPMKYMGVIIGTLVYESSILAAMIYRMFQDTTKSKLTEAFYRDGVVYYLLMLCALLSAAVAGFDTNSPVSQAYVGSMYFVGIKATLCSHIILRLRSYFSEDSIIYSSERTISEGDEAYDLSRTAGITIQISATRSSGPQRQELEWTDGPDPKRPKLVHRSRFDSGRNVWVATGYPNADTAGRGGIPRRSTSWLGRSGTPEGGSSSVVMGDSSDKVPSDLEMDEFTPESSSRDVRNGA
ncbi:hypothetical protein M407DRAFT_17997 [Tulasnella calospora MUT 4182]|uniref:DUF6533 domain-containing protein n=1 Tax=Tulasnella calospora MUT 4182 TaxID=1051891 RepID=A0A0C3QUN0_9AGAM|nr:hypothetical protein M407DRAFT_17997 [Tulasnella calospora MUT 4182]